MSSKKASERLEEKLVKVTIGEQAKGWKNFDEKKFERDAKRVSATFIGKDETILSKGNY